jgi:hypothetical protein
MGLADHLPRSDSSAGKLILGRTIFHPIGAAFVSLEIDVAP